MLKSNSKGIQPIIPGVTNIQGINIPLVTFDSLMDIDFGLMLYIDKNFLDPNIFHIDFFDSHHTVKQMLKALIERDHWNPLYLCLKEENFETADELYDEFMDTEKYYEQIVKLSMYTNICDFLKLSESSGGEVRPTVLCKTEFEKDFVKKHITKSIPVILYDSITNSSDRDYQQFILKHLYRGYIKEEGIINLIGKDKSIYLANYKFNDIDQIKESTAESFFLEQMALNFNRIRIYDMYEKQLLGGNK